MEGDVGEMGGDNRVGNSPTAVPQAQSRSSFMGGLNDRLRENPPHTHHPWICQEGAHVVEFGEDDGQ